MLPTPEKPRHIRLTINYTRGCDSNHDGEEKCTNICKLVDSTFDKTNMTRSLTDNELVQCDDDDTVNHNDDNFSGMRHAGPKSPAVFLPEVKRNKDNKSSNFDTYMTSVSDNRGILPNQSSLPNLFVSSKSPHSAVSTPSSHRRHGVLLRQGSKDDIAMCSMSTSNLLDGVHSSHLHKEGGTGGRTTSSIPTKTTASEVISESKKFLQRQSSQDDTCLVKTSQPSFIVRVFNFHNSLSAIKDPFPSFNVFKSTLQVNKDSLFDLHVIDSTLLYELLDNLSWSFCFQEEKCKSFTQSLLRTDLVLTRLFIQERLQFDFNVTIGNYEADMMLRYAMMYSKHFHGKNSVRLFDDSTRDKEQRDGVGAPYYYEEDDLPFSLKLPHHIKKSKWINCIDRLALRQFRESEEEEINVSRDAVNLLSLPRHNELPAAAVVSLPPRLITRRDVKEFRAAAQKRRPKRKDGFRVEIAVHRDLQHVDDTTKVNKDNGVALQEHKRRAYETSTFTSFAGRVYNLPPVGGGDKF